MKFNLLINVKIPTIVDILTFISRINTISTIVGILTFISRINTILTIVGILTFISRINTISEYFKGRKKFQYYSFYEYMKFHAQLSMKKF